jgi:hypothetical protein
MTWGSQFLAAFHAWEVRMPLWSMPLMRLICAEGVRGRQSESEGKAEGEAEYGSMRPTQAEAGSWL